MNNAIVDVRNVSITINTFQGRCELFAIKTFRYSVVRY